MRVVSLAALSVASVLLPVPFASALAVNEENTVRRLHEVDTEAEATLHILRDAPDLHAHTHQGTLHHKSHKKKHHKGKNLRHKEVSENVVTAPLPKVNGTMQTLKVTAGGAPGSAKYASVKAVVIKMAEQIAETSAKWEVENANCCKDRKFAEDTLEGLDESIAQANGQSSRAQGEILKASKKIAEQENKIPEQKDMLTSIEENCKSDKKGGEKDLKIISENLAGLDGMAMTSCSGKAALLQCEHPTSGESFLMLDHHTVTRKSAAQWQHKAVQHFLKGLSTWSEKSAESPPIFLQLQQHGNPQKCTMEANPECQQIRDRYLLMTSDVEDNSDAVKDKMKLDEDECKKNTDSIEENVRNANQQLKAQQTALAEATADYATAMESSRLTNSERARHLESMTKQAQTCADSKTGFVTEKNDLVKVRGETLKMAQITVFIQDCKVSDWTPQECSKACGGGRRLKTRDIMVNIVGDGADCPPLEFWEDCNMQHCPIDCKMGEWGGWSACSAKCGGGVFQRVRDINRKAGHGGKPCGEASEAQSCNPQSCESNCELGRWTKWSACSKACDTGSRTRVRRVKTAADGGTCPSEFSRKRRRVKSCHQKACLKPEDKDKSLKCNSKRDVILVIDGSASLRTSGWDQVKKAAGAVVKSMGADVQLAALLFSGPKTRKNYFKCSGQLWPDRKTGESLGPPDMINDCMVKWVQPFGKPNDAVLKKIEAMEWPRGSSLTSEALALAETELNNGRADAKSVVVVISDGKAMNKRKVMSAATRLRRKARLMWVTVAKNAPVGLIKKWASVPWQENAIFVSSFKDITKKKTMNALVANMCPALEVV